MKVVGIVLTALGGLMVIGGLNVALTKYDLNSTHDLSKMFGSLGISALILIAGVAMVVKSGSKK